ncbi:MAG: FAD-dependent oxidoreductase [Gordonia sp. (in: high G+C Gram-positive bacteria)]|uniref:NAD(P)/FAD-dependent oxidoreductase n=1 Tax=Gordonia sp. (in: high G+C Gram-positive bacteria) TaxID=84139 RepID=UPI0039E55F88
MTAPKIVIVGGGYAGCMAANRLRRKVPSSEITVVNARPDFVERVRLHQQIAGTGDPNTPITDMLADGVALKVATVDRIADGELVLDDGSTLGFDHLVYAALSAGARVTVVGGGLTGIETATEVAETRPDLEVTLVSSGPIGASLHPTARARVHAELARLGVTIVDGDYDGPGDADLVLWGIASTVSDLAARSGLAVDGDGRLCVDRFLVSVSDPRIFGAGDAAAVPRQRLSCRTALPQGAHAADNLARSLAGTPLKPFSMSYTGQNVSIGRRSAVIQISKRDDTPRRLWIGGRKAAAVKDQVCRFGQGGRPEGCLRQGARTRRPSGRTEIESTALTFPPGDRDDGRRPRRRHPHGLRGTRSRAGHPLGGRGGGQHGAGPHRPFAHR